MNIIKASLAWRVGNRTEIRIGADPWAGSRNVPILPQDMKMELRKTGHTLLSHIHVVAREEALHSCWKDFDTLGISDRWRADWARFIGGLEEANIKIIEREDRLILAKVATKNYSPKPGFHSIMETPATGPQSWWWISLWKLKAPHKSRLLFWAILSNKIPTNCNLAKCNLNGSSRCSLCNSASQDTDHLFLHYPVSIEIWNSIT